VAVRRRRPCARSAGYGDTCRFTINGLIAPIAFAEFGPFGQVSVQFMIVWQRYR
jgi:hypothetical protein